MSGNLRAVVCGSAVMFVACASLARLESSAPEEAPSSLQDEAATDPEPGSTGGNGSAVDAAKEDGAVPCVSPKTPNDPCTQASECCGGSCNEDGKCHDMCKAGPSDNCNPFSSVECCVRTYCSFKGWKCRACLDKGEDAEREPAPKQPYPTSCCSRAIDDDGKCK